MDRAVAQAVKGRGEPRDARGEQKSTGPQRPVGLSERGGPICRLREVVERPEQQHRFCRLVLVVQLAGVSDLGRRQRCRRLTCRRRASGLDLSRDGIDQVDLVPFQSQRQRVGAFRAADIQHHRGSSGQEPPEQLAGTRSDDHARPPAVVFQTDLSY